MFEPIKSGDCIDERYLAKETLGEKSGFAEVWKAYDQQIDRYVAIKILREDRCFPEILLRFEQEKEICGKMKHPYIPQIHGAGFYHERPYFAMEYVEGLPLDKYCKKHQLSLAEQLELFIEVCKGVQYTNERGVLHRDLKPSNILVERLSEKESAGEKLKHRPKVLDFGISKVLDSTEFVSSAPETRQECFLGTPEYVSPEQASLGSQEMTMRSDVYALGCILFELLAGDTPIAHATAQKLEIGPVLSMIKEKESDRASRRILAGSEDIRILAGHNRKSRARAIRGDLDAIAGMALAKESERRYPSAAHLADDLVRFLNHEPVVARLLGPLGKTLRFIRRNRAVSAAAGLTALAVTAASIISTIFYFSEAEARGRAESEEHKAQEAARTEAAAKRVAEEQRTEAVRALKVAGKSRDTAFVAMTEAEDLSNFMLFDLHEELEAIGRTKLLETVLRRSEAYLFKVAKIESQLAEGGLELSDAAQRRKRGVMHYNRGLIFLAWGKYSEAKADFAKAIAIYEETAAAQGDLLSQQDLVRAKDGKALALLRAGDLAEAGSLLEEQLKSAAGLERWGAADPETCYLVVVTHERLGDLARMQSRWDVALSNYETLERALLKLPDQNSPRALRFQAVAWGKLGEIHLRKHNPQQAMAFFIKEEAQFRQLSKAAPDDVRLQRAWSVALEHLGRAHLRLNQPFEAIPRFEERLKVAQTLASLDEANTGFLRDLATARQQAGMAFGLAGRPGTPHANQQMIQKSVQLCREALQNFNHLAKMLPGSPVAKKDVGITQIQLGLSLLVAAKPKAGNLSEIKAFLAAGAQLLDALRADPAFAFDQDVQEAQENANAILRGAEFKKLEELWKDRP